MPGFVTLPSGGVRRAVPGRWRGGFLAYRRPVIGYPVPRAWITPAYLISNWARYGLRAPAPGFVWYRYHGDAVMVDGRGRVGDWRRGIDWARGPVPEEADYDRGFREGYDQGQEDGADDAEDVPAPGGRAIRSGRPAALSPPSIRAAHHDDAGALVPSDGRSPPRVLVAQTAAGATLVAVDPPSRPADDPHLPLKRIWHAPDEQP